MQLTTEEILKMAHLARLGISQEEAKNFAPQLARFLEHAEKLNEVDTQGVEPIAQITGLKDIFFNDEVQSASLAQALLQQSPQTLQENMIKVPKTI